MVPSSGSKGAAYLHGDSQRRSHDHVHTQGALAQATQFGTQGAGMAECLGVVAAPAQEAQEQKCLQGIISMQLRVLSLHCQIKELAGR